MDLANVILTKADGEGKVFARSIDCSYFIIFIIEKNVSWSLSEVPKFFDSFFYYNLYPLTSTGPITNVVT